MSSSITLTEGMLSCHMNKLFEYCPPLVERRFYPVLKLTYPGVR